MVRTIIKAFPKERREPKTDGSAILRVAECFSETIQGENFVGYPAVFLRLQGCTLNCTWCDSSEVWRKGNQYTINELLKLFEDTGVIKRLEDGHHLVLTGGSPLRQQNVLISLIKKIMEKHTFKPTIEIENECTIMPQDEIIRYVDFWNNSPKLNNSKMNKSLRYKPEILSFLSELENAWFKFVVSKEEDWDEIKKDFIDTGLIKKHQIVIMPEGITRKELEEKYEWIVKLACRENVRMTNRLHITIWNRKVGV